MELESVLTEQFCLVIFNCHKLFTSIFLIIFSNYPFLVRWPHFDQFLKAYYGHGSAAVTPITLKNIDKSAFKAALRYFYCGKLPSSQSDVIELYRVAYAVSKRF